MTELSSDVVVEVGEFSFHLHKTCEDDVLFHAEELHIVSRCIDSLASKACADPSIFGWPLMEHYSSKNLEGSILWNGISPVPAKSPGRDWLYRDISVLKLPMYKRLILALKSKGAKPDDIAGSLMHYAKKYLPGLNKRDVHKESSSRPGLSETDQKWWNPRIRRWRPRGRIPRVDGYLAEIADDTILKCAKFQAIAASLPDYARPLDDGIYHAIDVFLKVLFFEQLRLRTTIAGWFFVSDNMDQNPPRVLPRSPKREGNGEETGDLRMDELRLRVIELERECSA
ncbi:hypothetical protein LUZ60_006534 [Juncus effusus]|nr:hypothetical protein LUZ60_006534 [Juncus effusus]